MRPEPPTLRRARRALLLVAAACLGYWTWATADSLIYQRTEDAKLERALAAGPGASEAPAGAPREPEAETAGASGVGDDPARAAALPPTGSTRAELPPTDTSRSTQAAERPARRRQAAAPAVLGRLEIPRIGLQTVVARTSDSRSLRRAAGHVAGTALPGDGDNVGLAGHRDTVFRKLRHVELGDRVTLTTPSGTRRYTVDSLDVVAPDAVEVLAPTDGETLTLVTCYPFASLGPAPDRFVVRARLADAG